MSQGERVRLKRAVDRFPHALVPEGATGVHVVDQGYHGVMLDDDYPGLNEWANTLWWYCGWDGEEQEFFDDIEPVSMLAEEG